MQSCPNSMHLGKHFWTAKFVQSVWCTTLPYNFTQKNTHICLISIGMKMAPPVLIHIAYIHNFSQPIPLHVIGTIVSWRTHPMHTVGGRWRTGAWHRRGPRPHGAERLTGACGASAQRQGAPHFLGFRWLNSDGRSLLLALPRTLLRPNIYFQLFFFAKEFAEENWISVQKKFGVHSEDIYFAQEFWDCCFSRIFETSFPKKIRLLLHFDFGSCLL